MHHRNRTPLRVSIVATLVAILAMSLFGGVVAPSYADGHPMTAEITSTEFVRIPNDVKEVTPEQRESIEKLIEKLEEDEDVQNVFHNMKEDENGDEE